MSKGKADEEGEHRCGFIPSKAQRRFNRVIVQRLGHSLLVGAGFGLCHFRRANPCGPLEESTARSIKNLRTSPNSKEP